MNVCQSLDIDIVSAGSLISLENVSDFSYSSDVAFTILSIM